MYGFIRPGLMSPLQRLAAPSCVVLLLSPRGLLPALLLERDPKAPLWRTPVGDDEAIRGLLSHVSMRLSGFVVAVEVVWRASPRGPPIEGSHEIGTQLVTCRWCDAVPTDNPISSSWDSINGEAVSFSLPGDVVDNDMEIER